MSALRREYKGRYGGQGRRVAAIAVMVVAGLVSLDAAPLTTGAAGLAAVSPGVDPSNGFPDWYRDSLGTTVQQCLDPADPHCVVLADELYDPTKPLVYPTNFPG
jgi:hypothetical protein